MAKEARTDLDATCDSRADAYIDQAKETQIEEQKNTYAVDKVVGNESIDTGTQYIAR